jgi:predicted phosphodiesterase
MAGTGLLERRPSAARLPQQRRRRAAALTAARRALTLAAVLAATLAGAYGALATYTQTQRLSVGEIRLSVSPGHKGALDLYVPLVDWGARFESIRLPVRLRVDVRTVDRQTVTRLAAGEQLDIHDVREEARNAIAAYLLRLIAITALAAAAAGLLVALAIRGGAGPRLRWTAPVAIGGAAATAIAMVLLLPPRGEMTDPQYYAHGADVPRALEAVETAQRSTRILDQELDAHLVGLARLVTDPADRRPLAGNPTLTIASDLHNNVLAIPILERAANDGPVLFPGDLTDRGSAIETRLVQRVVDTGNPFVFVSGNHDSDTLERRLAAQGAIVLTETGRLNPDGSRGDIVQKIGDLRIAGYSDPFERRSQEDFRDRYENTPTPAMQDDFTRWLIAHEQDVDVVMVHEPALFAPALEILRDDPPDHPLVFVTGHTHGAALDLQPGVTIVNGGSVGAGGTGNLADPDSTSIGLARFVFTTEPRFQPLAADLVSIDPKSGSSSARRERLDPPG